MGASPDSWGQGGKRGAPAICCGQKSPRLPVPGVPDTSKGTVLPQGTSVRDTSLLHPSTGCHETSSRAPAWAVWARGCRWGTGVGPACSHKRSALGKAGLKPAQSLGHRHGGITRWSCFTSAHNSSPQVDSKRGLQCPSPVTTRIIRSPSPPWGKCMAKSRVPESC